MGRRRRKNSDRISNLPEGITENILARLPIRDLVRTSLLSRYWRYNWTAVPAIVFDNESIGRFMVQSDSPSVNLMLLDDEIIKIIYRILCQHKGPIHKFAISVDIKISYHDINQWINLLSRNGIRELFLNFFCITQFKVHSSLFSCVNLRELSLCGSCMIPSPPSTFNGFNDLTCLKLNFVTLDDGFENVIAKCPQLRTLSLHLVNGLDRLNIDHAPNLQSLWFVVSAVNSICLKDTPSLSYARIIFCKLHGMNDENLGDGGSNSLINNLNGLSNLREFVAGFFFLKFIAEGSVRKSLPSTFNHLHRVHFYDLMFEDVSILSSVLGLITCSPNLEELVAYASWTFTNTPADLIERATVYLEGENHTSICFKKLRSVAMKNLLGVRPELEMIKLLLGKSPSLERIEITPDGSNAGFREQKSHMVKELMRFPRASKTAQVIYEGRV